MYFIVVHVSASLNALFSTLIRVNLFVVIVFKFFLVVAVIAIAFTYLFLKYDNFCAELIPKKFSLTFCISMLNLNRETYAKQYRYVSRHTCVIVEFTSLDVTIIIFIQAVYRKQTTQ